MRAQKRNASPMKLHNLCDSVLLGVVNNCLLVFHGVQWPNV